MATASSTPGAKAAMPLRKKIGYAALAIIGVVALWVTFNFSDIKAQAKLATSYGSHVACSCRYIEGRPLDSCYKDFEEGMEIVSLADDPANKRVTASVPLLASAMAERRGDYGCQQLNDKEMAALD
jgi:hypothetical protein